MSNPHSKNSENLKHQNFKSQNPKNPAPTKALRIAIFTDVFLGIPGGIPSSIRAQKTALESLGHQVTIFCPGTQQDFENPLSVLRHLKYTGVTGFQRAPFSKIKSFKDNCLTYEVAYFICQK